MPIALAPTGDLPARRQQLIREFPYAVDLVDFILGDLTSKPTVHIRPVLLTGTPGNGKTHFARRFAHVFGLHLWSVDCSHINYIATANSIDPLPWPLRDRLRIVAFPEPTTAHLDALMPPLLAEIATSRSLDPRFIVSLTDEDRTFIAKRWKAGSVRRLARLLEAIINARERAMLKH